MIKTRTIELESKDHKTLAYLRQECHRVRGGYYSPLGTAFFSVGRLPDVEQPRGDFFLWRHKRRVEQLRKFAKKLAGKYGFDLKQAVFNMWEPIVEIDYEADE